jgi:hypothetical protein
MIIPSRQKGSNGAEVFSGPTRQHKVARAGSNRGGRRRGRNIGHVLKFSRNRRTETKRSRTDDLVGLRSDIGCREFWSDGFKISVQIDFLNKNLKTAVIIIAGPYVVFLDMLETHA